jgi:hypothetical protein
LKKRAKKLLTFGRRARSRNEASSGMSAGAKVFCFFFFKKEDLASLVDSLYRRAHRRKLVLPVVEMIRAGRGVIIPITKL